MTSKVLVLGASGQIGTDLTLALRKKYGDDQVIASDIRPSEIQLGDGPFIILDALNKEELKKCIQDHNITEVYNMVAMLSATAEKHIWKAWDLNMTSLFNTLDLLKDKVFDKLFWPSSIAVFGPGLPQSTAMQNSVAEPKTVYGISKLAGERWCEYYALKFGCDVRSIRYPGIISYKTQPGGGTTDYAVEIFHSAAKDQGYECFLKEDRTLPMMYMDDAVKATIQIMESPVSDITVKSSYNINAISFNPKEIFEEIRKRIENFRISYIPDARDEYAQSWPAFIDDEKARKDWNWKHKYQLSDIVEDMLSNLKTLVL